MEPLTEQQLRASFVNATRGEVARATLPDLAAVPWDRLDLFGWRDAKAPQSAYVVVPWEGDDPAGRPVGLLLRASTPRADQVRRRAVCAWCADVRATDDVMLYVARRAGASGRAGNTVGTLLCSGFRCSENVRREPTREEGGTDEASRQAVVERRVAGLRERSARFVAEVLSAR